MNVFCPFCKQAYEVDATQLDQKIECSVCKRLFSCSIVATPLIGSMYVDIETTASPEDSSAVISSIVWWSDGEWHSWVNERDDAEQFLMYWRNAKEVITFCGKSFDEPRICKHFNVGRHPNHIDLHTEGKSLGISGGLKEIGAKLEFPRPQELANVDGATAIKLWKRYRFYGDDAALQNLLYYNAWDVALTYLLHMKLTNQTPQPIYESIPFQYDESNMISVLPKQSGPRRPRKLTGPIKEYWEERKKNPLTTLRGAEVCITGDLPGIEREDAEALIESLGGAAKKSVVRTLDFLVVGYMGGTTGYGSISASEPGGTGKMQQAKELIAEGAHTRMITVDEFAELVEKTKQAQT